MLKDFYDKYDVPKGDRIPLEKNILLLVPASDYDLTVALKGLELSRFEVAVTWPKASIDMLAEISELGPKLVVQCGHNITRKFRSATTESEFQALRPLALTATADSFVGLHHHDEFSIRDGLGTVKHLVSLLKCQRRSFCCVSNHGTVGGWVRQYKACKEAGIKAIFAMEAYTSQYRGDDMEEKKKHRKANHLLLIARTREGFDNIIRIHNDAQINGFYYSPRVNDAAMEKWGKGIVATSACMKNDIPELLMAGKEDEARRRYEFYAKCFDRFYIEMQIIECEAQREINRRLIKLAQSVGAPLVVGIDSHYLEPEHYETHNILMCIRQGKTVMQQKEQDDIWEFDVGNLYYRNAAQVRRLFHDGFVEKGADKKSAPFCDDVFTSEIFETALANTRLIAVESEVIKLDSTVRLPKLYTDGQNILRDKVNAGFKKRGLDRGTVHLDQEGNEVRIPAQKYIDRLKYEFGVITKLGWTDYVLIVERFISDARDKHGEWVIGFGRGSAASSVVAYCLGITDVNPLVYGLLFERFLDEERKDTPDIDCDFDPRYREDIKRHIVEIFGEERVCSIGSYQMYRTASVIFDVARTLNYDIHEARVVTKQIDSLQRFEDEEGEEHKADDMSFDDLCKHYPDLKDYFDKYPDVRRHAEILRNQVKNMSTHAGGVIISDVNLQGRIPVLYDKPGSASRKIISAWAEAPGKSEELSAVGLVKFDILGLNTLSVISDCIAMIEKTRGRKICRADVPIDDREAIRLGSKGDLVGIFQLENPTTLPVANEIGLETLEDISALASLIRPGPRNMGMDMEYAHRKQGQPYDIPELLKKLLADSYGCIIFQEQCMTVAQKVGGLSKSESYAFVKAIAKKLPDKMAAFRQKFIDGSKPLRDSGEITMEDVEAIYDLLEAFAKYGFNKCVTLDTVVETPMGMKLMGEVVIGDKVKIPSGEFAGVLDVIESGNQEVWEFTTETGKSIRCTLNHKFLCEDGKMKTMDAIVAKNLAVMCEVQAERIVSARLIGSMPTRNITIDTKDHIFLANGMATSNSHSASYSAISAVELWLKYNFLPEFMCSLINNTNLGKEKHGSGNIMVEYINYARRKGVPVLCPHINESKDAFTLNADKAIRFSLSHVKFVASKAAVIEAAQPIESMADFHERVKVTTTGKNGKSTSRRPNKRQVESLIAAGAFDHLGTRNQVTAEYHRVRANKKEKAPEERTDEEWESMERDAIGLCLSKEPLYKQYEELIRQKKWVPIHGVGNNKKVYVFGQIESVASHTSKAGNSMFIVTLGDGVDVMKFFVFKSAMEFFRDKVKEKNIGAFPLDKFDESDARFFDERRGIEIVVK